MPDRDEISFHARRALAELALAVRASTVKAAHAHFCLSGLHLERVRQLCPTTELTR